MLMSVMDSEEVQIVPGFAPIFEIDQNCMTIYPVKPIVWNYLPNHANEVLSLSLLVS